MKKNTKTLLIISILIAALMLTACGQAQTPGDGASAAQASANAGNQAAANDQNAVYGEVTAINGNVITLAVGTLNQQARPSGQRQQGSDVNGQGQPNQSAGQPDASSRPSGSRPSMLTMTGETKTITVSDESIITRPAFNRQNNGQNGNGQNGQQNNQESGQQPQFSNEKASLSDIQVGTTLRIVYASDKTTIQSIVIMGGFSRGNGAAGQNASGASAAPSASS